MANREEEEPRRETFIPATVEFGDYPPDDDMSDFLDWLQQELPKYKQGSPESPGEGYTEFEIIKNPDITNNSFRNEVRQFTRFRYRQEEYQEEEGYVDGEFREVYTREINSVDIFWVDKILFFQGTHQNVAAAKNRLQTNLLENLRIKAVDLNPGYYRRLQDFPIKYVDNLTMEETRSMSVKGTEDVSQVRLYGRDTSDTYDKYVPENGKVSYFMGYFSFYDYRILADISEKIIHIRSLSNPHRPIGDRERLFVIFSFLKRLVEISRAKDGGT